METIKSKSLSYLIFIPLSLLIFIRPFFSELAYPILETYYQNSIIALAIIFLFTNRKIILKNPYNIPILLLLSAYLISSFSSIKTEDSVKEIIKFISCFCVLFLVSPSNDKQKKMLIKSIVIAASIISIYSIYQYFWGYQHTLDYLKKINSSFLLYSSYARDILISKRAIGTFPSPNILGGYLIITFFLAAYMLFEQGDQMQPSRKLFSWGAKLFSIIAIIFALILTKSMGAWLSLVFTLIIVFIFSYKSLKNWKLIAVFSFIFIAFALTFILTTRWDRLVDMKHPQNSITQRLNYWRTAIAIIKDHPILGVGPGNFKEVFLKYKTGVSTDTIYAHNIFLHQWAETGLLGLAGIIYLIINFFRKFKSQPERRIIFFSGLAFLMHNLIDNGYFIPQVCIFWWILLALAP